MVAFMRRMYEQIIWWGCMDGVGASNGWVVCGVSVLGVGGRLSFYFLNNCMF